MSGTPFCFLEVALSDLAERLWQLQSELSNLAEREHALKSKPEGFAALDEEFTAAKERKATLEARLEELQKRRREQEREMQTAQELLKKFQGQLMQVKNQQQYAAVHKEIEAARKSVKDLEDETLKQMSAIEEAEGELATLNSSFDDLSARHQSGYDEWQSSLGETKKEADALRAKVASLESGVPEQIKREFYQVHKQRNGVAMVKLADGTCAGCRVKIRPQVVQQIKRGELGKCEGCRRFLHP